MSIWKKHKTATIITALACTLLVVVAALYFTHQIQGRNGKQDIPLGVSGDRGVFGDDVIVHDSTEGEIIIAATLETDKQISDMVLPLVAAPMKTISDPEAIWQGDAYAGNHTPVEKAQMKDGSIGILTIGKLNLSVNVYESTDAMEDMAKGIAHFPSTSAYDGNVGFSAHNVNFDGTNGYFKYLHTLEKGDSIQYQTALGERSYSVISVATISETDWTPLNYTDDNRLTLITCISGQPGKRLSVQAVETAK